MTRRNLAREVALDTARGFGEELLLLVVQAALVVAPVAVGWFFFDGVGLFAGLLVGFLLLGAFWLWMFLTGARGLWQAWRGTGPYASDDRDPTGAQR